METKMNTILVDDEQIAIDIFQYEARGLEDLNIVGTFDNAEDALAYTRKHKVDLAVLDIQLQGMDGLELGRRLQQENPDLRLIYITGSDDYVREAVSLQAAGYLTKPYSSGELAFALEVAKQRTISKHKRVFAKTFGHFDLYVDGKPIMFRSGKAKELLALLIDREGGTVTSDQIIGTLWEDRPNDEATQSLCSKIGKTLQKELKQYQAEDLVISSRGVKRIDTDLFDCDLYQMLSGDQKVTEQYMGEYMIEYSWAENRMALLEKYIKRQKNE